MNKIMMTNIGLRHYRITISEVRPVYRDSRVTVGQHIVRTGVTFETSALTPWCAVLRWADQISDEAAS